MRAKNSSTVRGESGALHIVGAVVFLILAACVFILLTSIGKIRVTEQKADVLEEQFRMMSKQLDDLDTRVKILEVKNSGR